MTVEPLVAARSRDPLSDHNAPLAHPKAPPDDVFSAVGLIGRTPVMARLRSDVVRYARTSAPVLVTGETGSGKEVVARALHAASPRRHAPFVAVNVATLRSDLAASELFGHERGAFTGALARRRGVFEQAHGGTLLLDEIGELDAPTRADLLRVLESGEVRPVGGERTRTVDVRIIAATHRDLASMVGHGAFREDLYFRLNVLPLAVPPLRDRRGDLPALVDHLLHRLRPEVGDRRLTPEALALLTRRPWPGNVRQLVNVLRRALARDDRDVVDAESVARALDAEPGPQAPVPYRVTACRDLSPVAVAEAMQASGGNVARAARQLGVARSTLRDRLPEAR